MKKFIKNICVLFALVFVGCASSKPQLSQMQIREMTSKEMQGNFKTVFQSTMTILQDQGYIISNTDFDAGLILGEKELDKETASDVMMILFVDMNHKRSGKIQVSATVSEVTADISSVRLNIQEKFITKGTGGTEEETETILEKPIFDALLNQINIEVQRRIMLSSGTTTEAKETTTEAKK